MKTGRILWYDKRDGNGIIKDSKNNEFYFDDSVLKTEAIRDKIVLFNVNENIKECACATDVHDLDAANLVYAKQSGLITWAEYFTQWRRLHEK